MKIHLNEWLLAFALLGGVSVLGQPTLEVKWGLENTNYFKESSISSDLKPIIRNKPAPPARMIRSFAPNSKFNEEFPTEILPRLIEAHEKYLKMRSQNESQSEKRPNIPPFLRQGDTSQLRPRAQSNDRDRFSQYLKREDPFTMATIRKMAPELYFDFLGMKGKEYILEEIEIRTIRFDEYKGGGFADREAWYDIELKHAVGNHAYKIENGKLRFDGSGRCILRFWSDNYNEHVGMTPMGSYDVDITFQFVVEGKRVRVSTGHFNIDV